MLASLGLSTARAAEIAWVESFEKAQELAKKSGKLIMADFWRDG